MFLFTVVLEINVYLIVFHDARVRLISCGNRNVSIASLRQATRSKLYMSLMTVVCYGTLSLLHFVPRKYSDYKILFPSCPTRHSCFFPASFISEFAHSCLRSFLHVWVSLCSFSANVNPCLCSYLCVFMIYKVSKQFIRIANVDVWRMNFTERRAWFVNLWTSVRRDWPPEICVTRESLISGKP